MRSTGCFAPVVVLALACLVVSAPPSLAEGGDIVFTDTIRDVGVDGRLIRGALVYSSSSPDRLAIVAPGLDEIPFLEKGADGWKAGTLRRSDLVADSTGPDAHCPPSAVPAATEPVATLEDGVLLFAVGGHSVVVAPHVGLIGEVARDEVWQTVPSWRLRHDAAEADDEVVETLRGAAPARIRVFFGTWCGDSRAEVPRLLAALEAAGNAGLELELVGIRRGFDEPAASIRDARVTNVPTIVVERGGRELGRIVETPATTVEADLAAILDGKDPGVGRPWDGEDRLASGVYRLADPEGRAVARETWTLFRASSGGRRLHSLVEAGDEGVEVWERFDERGTVTFVEVTRRFRGEIERTRWTHRDGHLWATSRGSAVGVGEQELALSPAAVLLAPTTASLAALASDGSAASVEAAVLGPIALARLEPLELERLGETSLETPDGERNARRLRSRLAGQDVEWQLDAELGVPLAARFADGRRIELVELDVD